MKRFLAVFSLVALAAVTAMTWMHAPANAARYRTIPVKWSSGADTTFIEDENDTLRTAPIDLTDWDISIDPAATSAANLLASVAFVVSGANDGNADTVYYAIEKSWDGTTWTQGSLAAAAGACAVLQGGFGAVVPATFAGTLVLDFDTLGGNFLMPLIPRMFRLKVAGDQAGTTPALSQVRCYLTYPTLFDY